MKKFLLIGLISFLSFLPMAGKSCPGHSENCADGGCHHEFGEKLGLTEEQKKKMKQLRESFKKDMDAILTPEQKEIAKKLKEEKKAKIKEIKQKMPKD